MSVFIKKQGKFWPQAVLTVALSVGMAHAATVNDIQLPAQSLDKSLTQLARQTGVSFGVESQLVAGKQAQALNGRYSVEQALEALLRGNNLYAEPTEDGKGFIIRPLAQIGGGAAQDGEEDSLSPSAAGGKTQNGDVITVEARAIPGPMEIGSQQLTAEDIAKKPASNGNVTELLRTNPNVQFAETSRSSATPGEIAPDVVSFHGEKFYNNNFIIDGMSNNDRLNPGDNVGEVSSAPNGNSANDFPSGHPESFWIDTGMIESMSVYDSNVSAKYGQFTGGVIDVKLKRPSFSEASGSIGYRTTRDAWTKYHLTATEAKTFDTATSLNKQPRFTKNFYNLMVSQPVNDNAAIMFMYNRKESSIPYWHKYMEKWSDQERLSESYMLRGSWDPNDNNQLDLTLMVSPHSATYVRANTKNGEFTNEGGGFSANLKWENKNAWGNASTNLIYKQNENTITNQEQNYFNWLRTASIDWASSASAAQEGGYGKVQTSQRGINLKHSWQFNPFSTFGAEHRLESGFDVDLSEARYRRGQTSYAYSNPKRSSTIVCDGDVACIDGEQYQYKRTVYGASDVTVNAGTYGAFLQDTLKAYRLTAVPGVRVDFDDYMQNLNVSPRFSASYDVWGDRSTELFGGVNRYYAGNVLAYKLRSARAQSYTECRADHINSSGSCSTSTTTSSVPAAWVYEKATTAVNYRYTELDTPYSDETNLGVQQRIYNTIWAFKWVHREGKDQFVRSEEKINGAYELTNNGKSESDTYSLVISPESPIEWRSALFKWSIGGNIYKSTSSNRTYDEDVDADGYIIYNNKMIRAIDKPADDFNRPWAAFVELNTEIPDWRIDWTQRVSYVGGYKDTVYKTTVNCPDDYRCNGYEGSASVYEEEQFGDNLLIDWRITYTQPIGKQKVKVGLDVLNVLDRANKTESNYGLGRQFWLDVSYSW